MRRNKKLENARAYRTKQTIEMGMRAIPSGPCAPPPVSASSLPMTPSLGKDEVFVSVDASSEPNRYLLPMAFVMPEPTDEVLRAIEQHMLLYGDLEINVEKLAFCEPQHVLVGRRDLRAQAEQTKIVFDQMVDRLLARQARRMAELASFSSFEMMRTWDSLPDGLLPDRRARATEPDPMRGPNGEHISWLDVLRRVGLPQDMEGDEDDEC